MSWYGEAKPPAKERVHGRIKVESNRNGNRFPLQICRYVHFNVICLDIHQALGDGVECCCDRNVFHPGFILRHGGRSSAFSRRLVNKVPLIKSAAELDNSKNKSQEKGDQQRKLHEALPKLLFPAVL